MPGNAFIVTTAVVVQPVPNEYVIVAVPDATPQNTPDVGSIVATVGVLLDHVPPAIGLVSVLHEPTQADSVPPIVPGSVFTVTLSVE